MILYEVRAHEKTNDSFGFNFKLFLYDDEPNGR